MTQAIIVKSLFIGRAQVFRLYHHGLSFLTFLPFKL